MKRRLKQCICVLLCLVLGLFFVSCGEIADADAAKREIEVILMLLCEGDYEAVIAKLDDSMEGQLTVELLEIGWMLEADPAGEFVSVLFVDAGEHNGAMLAQIYSQHENGQVRLMCGFTKDLRIQEFVVRKVSDEAPSDSGSANE